MKQEVVNRIIQENRRGYNQIAEKFSNTRKYPWREFNTFKAYVKHGQAVLDAGCGNGRLYNFLLDKKINYSGLDSSKQLIAIAKREHPNINFGVGDITVMPYPDNSFDVIFCIATLHHIPGDKLRQKVISEFRRVLKPGGYLLMTNWNLFNLQWWPALMKYSLKKLFGQNQLDWRDVQKPWKDNYGAVTTNRYLHAFTKNEVKEILKRNNFSHIEQFYSKKYSPANWIRGFNLVSIAR